MADHPPRAALKLLFMDGMTPFTYGDEVRVINGEYKGRKGAIVGMNDPDTPSVFTVEFGDGSDAEVPLESLEMVETDIILPPDSLDDENGNCKQCGHPFNPHIIVANDANDFSKGGEMRCPVENCDCFATVHFDMKDEQGA